MLMPISPEETQILAEPGAVTVLKLSGHQGLNLLSSATMQSLLKHLEQSSSQPDLRVLILTGSERAFCAGADMQELTHLVDIPAYIDLGQELTQTLENYPVPVIAAVDGHALGAGFSLALACDFRVLSAQARLGQLAVRNGLIPPFGNIQRLMQVAGPARARDLILTGRSLEAASALAYGLADRLSAETEPALPEAQRLAQSLCRSPRYALQLAKQVIQRSLEAGYAVGYACQEEALLACLEHPDSRAIMEGFLSRTATP